VMGAANKMLELAMDFHVGMSQNWLWKIGWSNIKLTKTCGSCGPFSLSFWSLCLAFKMILFLFIYLRTTDVECLQPPYSSWQSDLHQGTPFIAAQI
jgi:hypothetical protein